MRLEVRGADNVSEDAVCFQQFAILAKYSQPHRRIAPSIGDRAYAKVGANARASAMPSHHTARNNKVEIILTPLTRSSHERTSIRTHRLWSVQRALIPCRCACTTQHGEKCCAHISTMVTVPRPETCACCAASPRRRLALQRTRMRQQAC
jgi:hypothetical protein